MRTLLIAPVLASFALTTVRPADACGPYMREPTLMRISGHRTESGNRVFAITSEAMPAIDHDKWVRLAPRTYDYAAVADAPNLARAIDMTLIGPSGTRVVSSRERVYLSQTFVSHGPNVAMEIRVPSGKFSIAIAGKHDKASWIELATERRGDAKDIAWVEAQGIEPLSDQYVYVTRLQGTAFEAVTVFPRGGGMTTLVRSNGTLYSQFEGSVMGGIEMNGQHYAVASKHGEAVRAIAL